VGEWVGGGVGEVGGSSLEDIGFQPGQFISGRRGMGQWGEISVVPAPAWRRGLTIISIDRKPGFI